MTGAAFGDTLPVWLIGDAKTVFRYLALGFIASLGSLISPCAAQDALRSECLAVARAPYAITQASLRFSDTKADEVAITYVGHSTYHIDTPGGTRIATDYSGAY